MKIDYQNRNVRFKGVNIQLEKVKEMVIKKYPALVQEFQVHKSFNSKTGNIDRKYAWDSIFYHLKTKKLFIRGLERLIKGVKDEPIKTRL